MDSVLTSPQIVAGRIPTVKTSTATVKTNAFWNELEKSRFGMTPVFLVLAACLGGFAAAAAVQTSLIMLSIIGLSTGLVEVMLIAVVPMRTIFWFLVAAVAIDVIAFFI